MLLGELAHPSPDTFRIGRRDQFERIESDVLSRPVRMALFSGYPFLDLLTKGKSSNCLRRDSRLVVLGEDRETGERQPTVNPSKMESQLVLGAVVVQPLV